MFSVVNESRNECIKIKIILKLLKRSQSLSLIYNHDGVIMNLKIFDELTFIPNKIHLHVIEFYPLSKSAWKSFELPNAFVSH